MSNKKTTKKTWYDMERLAPQHWTFPWVRHQHLTRYYWARQFIQGAGVFDAACGHGYGSAILAEGGANRVKGFDLCSEVVDQARQTYRHIPCLSFCASDVRRLPEADASCDAYVSFETVEHIVEDREFLAEAARTIRPGGKFICSTPNRDLFDPGTTLTDVPFNPFHVRGYVQEEFRDFLAASFPKIEWFGQSWYGNAYCRRLAALGKKHRKLAMMVHQAREVCGVATRRAASHIPTPLQAGKSPEIWIAVCTVG